MAYKKVPWKRNLRKIPTSIIQSIEQINGDIVVSTVIRVPEEHIVSGRFEHLDISYQNNSVVFPDNILPYDVIGKYSKMNLYGKTIIRRDLPMEVISIDIDSPNFGDWTKGSHSVTFYIHRYPRELVSPKLINISISKLGEEQGSGGTYHIFRLEVDEILDPNSDGFFDDLLFNLNVLQENCGIVNVYSSKASREEYLSTLYIDWEIIPLGQTDNTFDLIVGNRGLSDNQTRRLRERFDFLLTLNPRSIISGTSGFHRYFGAMIRENLVIFENTEYGNAMYIMFEDWQQLSQKSRTELLAGFRDRIIRIDHRGDWQKKVKKLLENI